MHWQLDYPLGAWGTGVAIVIVTLVVLASFAWVAPRLWPPRPLGAAVISLRLLALAMIVFMLLEPSVITSRTATVPPHVALLLDVSGSMGVTDEGDAASRIEQAATALRASGLAAELQNQARLTIYGLDRDLTRLDAEQALTMTSAAGRATSLGGALQRAADLYRGEPLAGVILLSDGRDNTGIDPLAAVDALPGPLFAVGLGKARPAVELNLQPDLAVVDVAHERRIIIGQTTDVTVTVSSRGLDARTVPVELVQDDRVLARSSVALSPDRPERPVTLALTPQVAGQQVYEVRVPPDSAEQDVANNRRSFTIVVTDPVARVLYVESRPRWEFKFISRVLADTPNLSYTSVLQLGADRAIIQGTDPAQSQVIAAMTPDQLLRLKVIILGDVPHAVLSVEQLRGLAKLVEDGASLMLLGGRQSLGPEGFARTPLASVLPIQLNEPAPYREEDVRVRLTPSGAAHPTFSGVNVDWSQAAPLMSYVEVEGRVLPGATVLLETAQTPARPLVVTHRYGQGKVVVVLSDTLWRWRLGAAGQGVSGEDLQTVFWRQLINWMLPEEDRQLADRRSVQMVADRLAYELEDDITLTLSVTGDAGEAVPGARVSVRAYAPDGRLIERDARPTQTEGGAPAYIVSFPAHVAGTFRVVGAAEDDDGSFGRDEISLTVTDPSIELADVDPDHDLLRSLATAGGGSYHELSDLQEILAALDLTPAVTTWTRRESLWDKWPTLVIFLALVTAEWFCRKRLELE